MKWADFETQYLMDHWSSEGSKAVAVVLDRDWKAVQRKAFRMGLKCDSTGRYLRHGSILSQNNKSCDTEYFTREWSANMAYILGYIYADGCLQKYYLAFLCHSKDEEILLAIHKELKCRQKIHRSQTKYLGRNNGPRTFFNASSKKLVDSLIKRFGLQPRKSFLDLPMPEVPDKFFGHFLRGYFDGDGYVGGIRKEGYKYGCVSIVATKTFAEQMQSKVCNLTKSLKTKLQEQSCGGLIAFSWGCHQDLKAIHSLMYPPGEYIFLKRKREMFDRVIKQSPTRLVRSVLLSQSPN